LENTPRCVSLVAKGAEITLKKLLRLKKYPKKIYLFCNIIDKKGTYRVKAAFKKKK